MVLVFFGGGGEGGGGLGGEGKVRNQVDFR